MSNKIKFNYYRISTNIFNVLWHVNVQNIIFRISLSENRGLSNLTLQDIKDLGIVVDNKLAFTNYFIRPMDPTYSTENFRLKFKIKNLYQLKDK